MYTRCWQILKDDTTRTFEICGQSDDGNLFTNTTHGMQKAGMNVSCATPPVGGKYPSKDAIKIFGYVKEEGLQARLMKEYSEAMRKGIGDW